MTEAHRLSERPAAQALPFCCRLAQAPHLGSRCPAPTIMASYVRLLVLLCRCISGFQASDSTSTRTCAVQSFLSTSMLDMSFRGSGTLTVPLCFKLHAHASMFG